MRMTKAICQLFLIMCLGLVTAGCRTQPSLREQLDALAVKHLDFYHFDPSAPLIDRVTDAPAELLDLYSSVEETPLLPCRLSAAEHEQIRMVLDRLPLRHREVLQQRLIGIYCVDNFSGSGMADYIPWTCPVSVDSVGLVSSSATSVPQDAVASSRGYPHAPEGGPQKTSRTGACG